MGSRFSLTDDALLRDGLGKDVVLSRFATSWWFHEISLLFNPRNPNKPIYPEKLVKGGQTGFIMLKGVPFMAIRLSGVSRDSAVASLRSCCGEVHGQSAWNKEMPIANRIMMTPLPSSSDILGIVAHTDWQEELIRSTGTGTAWERLDPQ